MCAPPFLFPREHSTLRRILQAAGHQEGIAYAEAMYAKEAARRLADGSTPITVLSAVYIAETDLKISARQEGK
jgi:hypothetical protein